MLWRTYGEGFLGDLEAEFALCAIIGSDCVSTIVLVTVVGASRAPVRVVSSTHVRSFASLAFSISGNCHPLFLRESPASLTHVPS